LKPEETRKTKAPGLGKPKARERFDLNMPVRSISFVLAVLEA
jgi:hypothetical protein